MNKKNNLLSIGDMAKLTGAGIKSLRYYERINILKPTYVSPDTGYRYYTLDQTHLVEIIMFCIELDIPLAEMAKLIEADGTMNFREFFAKGRAVAEKKLGALKKGLKLLDHIEAQMNLAEDHKIGEIYTRQIPEKYLYVRPCGPSLKDINQADIILSFSNMDYPYDNEMPEYGFLCHHTPSETMYYAFVEVSKDYGNKPMLTIPGGVYHCRHDENKLIEKASQVFGLPQEASYYAIEIEIITSKHKVNEPVNELRIMAI